MSTRLHSLVEHGKLYLYFNLLVRCVGAEMWIQIPKASSGENWKGTDTSAAMGLWGA